MVLLSRDDYRSSFRSKVGEGLAQSRKQMPDAVLRICASRATRERLRGSTFACIGPDSASTQAACQRRHANCRQSLTGPWRRRVGRPDSARTNGRARPRQCCVRPPTYVLGRRRSFLKVSPDGIPAPHLNAPRTRRGPVERARLACAAWTQASPFERLGHTGARTSG
jgi:hypothetical protein